MPRCRFRGGERESQREKFLKKNDQNLSKPIRPVLYQLAFKNILAAGAAGAFTTGSYTAMPDKTKIPGLTLKAVLASIFALLLMSVMIQYFEVVVLLTFPAEHTLALPAIWTLILLSAIGGLFYLVTKTRLLTRPETLCVLFTMLLAAPIVTQGFWHRLAAIVATIPREADFARIDAYDDKLWPHGPELLDDVMTGKNPSVETELNGNAELITVDVNLTDKKQPIEGPAVRLRNTESDDASSIGLKIPLHDENGNLLLKPGEPYIISALIRPKDMGSRSEYYCRAFVDGQTVFTNFFSGQTGSRKTILHRTGFVRVGAYGMRLPGPIQESLTIEIGLKGTGELEITDPQFFNVAALEGMYRGVMVISQSEYDKLPLERRAGLVPKPDNMFSWRGVKFILAGYIPIRDWINPILAWTSIIALLLLGTFSINCIMRKQWMDNERFQMPVTKIPLSLIGEEDFPGEAMPPIYKNRLAWIGFALALAWGLMKAWAFYNPKVPDMSVRVMLQPIFSDPSWGGMWRNVRFEITAIFLAMCIFMELNILMSLVIGYFLFKSQFWVGEMTGMNVDPNFPYTPVQATGAYIAYALVVVFFTRKYLWRVLKAAVTGDKAESEGEVISYRSAMLLLLGTIVGSIIWARWMQVGVVGMLVFFLFLLLVGFVTSKVRTECGAPWGYFAPINVALLMVLLGGVSTFGGRSILFCYLISFMIAPTVFFLIPGAQMEMIEIGRRWNIKRSHILGVILIGVGGGIIIGGWVFLSNAYALGGESLRYNWSFTTKSWYLHTFNKELDSATLSFFGESVSSGISKGWYGFGFAAIGTMVVTVLRQMFAGFWFHPLGFVLGSSNMLDYVWGSALTAAFIRWTMLKLGGAATVKTKVRPFFVGVFMGGCTAYLLLGIHIAYLRHIGIDKVYPILLP